MVFKLLRECIRQPGEAAHVHPHGEVLALYIAGADMLCAAACTSIAQKFYYLRKRPGQATDWVADLEQEHRQLFQNDFCINCQMVACLFANAIKTRQRSGGRAVVSVFRPQYKDKKSGQMKHTRVWYYKFTFAGREIKESAKTPSKTVAKEAEKKRRRELEEGFNGIMDARADRIRGLRQLATQFLKDYKIRQPKSVSFAEHAIGHVQRLMGNLMAVDIADKTALKYQTDRLAEGAAPKTINEEVGFLLRLLPVAHAGAIRAQLKQQKKLKLKVPKRVGKAYTEEEKIALVSSAKSAKRSRGIHFATMLAQHAGLRDKEIRTLQWNRMNLVKRMLTVGQTKSDAGTGRTIPMNDELLSAAAEYASWYTDKFGPHKPEWFVFPFGRAWPQDPTRPQTSLKTAWRNIRKKAGVQGRWHDNRHTFVTDLAESGAGDQVIQDLAGHVSPDMVKHYSHIRTEAKRRAVGALSKAAAPAAGKAQEAPSAQKKSSEAVVQDSVQVRRKRRSRKPAND